MRAYWKQKGRFFVKFNGDICWFHIEYYPWFSLLVAEKDPRK